MSMGNSADRPYSRKWLESYLGALFAPSDLEVVVNWLSTHRGQPKVVLIGSGFSRNAILSPDQLGEVSDRVPLWWDVTAKLRAGLGYFENDQGPSDPLLIAEQYQESKGRPKLAETLLGLMKDREIEPGPAHNALADFNVEAIITTNQLDTLLDRMEGEWFTVIDNTDLPIARAQASRKPHLPARQVIYLHGHRSAPKGWVFSRSEYESVYDNKPALVRRVQQLLSEYPLLVLGYSLSDPDFHWLFSGIHREQEGFMPRALCVTVGRQPPRDAERAHWKKMGMHLAHLQGAPSDSLSTLLRAEASGSDGGGDAILDWIRSQVAGRLDLTTELRLAEFERSLPDLRAADEASQGTNFVFAGWYTCLPTYENTPRDKVIDLGPSLSPVQSKYTLLPPIPEWADEGEARNLLEACQHFLSGGGTKVALGNWLAAFKKHRVKHKTHASLGDNYLAVLELVAAEFVEDTPGGRHEIPGFGYMAEATTAFLQRDWEKAACNYDLAANTFERSGDDIGAWQATESRIFTLVSALNALDEVRLSSSQNEGLERELRIERARQRRLETVPAVHKHIAKRDRILVKGLSELEKRASAQDSPTGHSVSFSVTHAELANLLYDEERAAVCPGLLRQLGAAVARFEETEESEVVRLGLRLELKEAHGRLATQDQGSLRKQSELEQDLSQLLLKQATVGPETTVTPQLMSLLPSVKHRLTADVAHELLKWVISEISRGELGSADYTPFGVVARWTYLKTFAALFTDAGWLLDDPLSRLSAFVASLPPNSRLREAFWEECAGWHAFACLSRVGWNDLVRWHVTAGRESTDAREQEAWLKSLYKLLGSKPDSVAPSEATQSLLNDVFSSVPRDVRQTLQLGLRELIRGELSPPQALDAIANWDLETQLGSVAILMSRGHELKEQHPVLDGLKQRCAAVLKTSTADERRFGPDLKFELAAICLALKFASTEELENWVLQRAASDPKAELSLLAPAIRRGAWGGSIAQLAGALPVNPLRDHHLARLMGRLVGGRDGENAIPPPDIPLCLSIAERNAISTHVGTALQSTQLLVQLLVQLGHMASDGIEVSRVRRRIEAASSDVRTMVRAALGYQLARDLHRVGLGEWAREIVSRLRDDHTIVVRTHVLIGEADARTESDTSDGGAADPRDEPAATEDESSPTDNQESNEPE